MNASTLVVLALPLQLALVAAAEFTVTSTADAGPGSLRQAILDGNSRPGADSVTLTGVVGTITLSHPLPALADSTSLRGPGSELLTVHAGARFQILTTAAGTSNLVSGLAFAGGLASNALHGGAISNGGALTLRSCAFSNNLAVGGFGGALYNSGDLRLEDCLLVSNRVVGGSGAGGGLGGGLGGGGGGFGGGLYSVTGSLVVSNCTFLGNDAAGGEGRDFDRTNSPPGTGAAGGGLLGGAGGLPPAPGADGNPGSPGDFGSGGGGGSQGYRGGAGGAGRFGGGGGGGGKGEQTGFKVIVGGQGGAGGFGGGPGGGGGIYADVTGQGGGGGAGFGGAVFVESGLASVDHSVFEGNRAVGGTGASTAYTYGSIAAGGGAGMGGAIFLFGGQLRLDGCTLTGNEARGGAAGNGYHGSGPGGAAWGAGVMSLGDRLEIVGSLVVSNQAFGGHAGRGDWYGDGGGALGAGVAANAGTNALLNSTLVGNSAVGGDAPPRYYANPSPAGVAGGGGVWATNASLSLRHCTVAGNRVQPGLSIQDPPGLAPPRAGPTLGGGLAATVPPPELGNTLFAGNVAVVVLKHYESIVILSSNQSPSDVHGAIASLGHNLFETATNLTGLVTGDLTNVAARLGPLQDNGGPTRTLALERDSPALNAGANATSAPTDQRGVRRPQDATADIGAFEFEALAVVIDGRHTLPGLSVRNTPAQVSLETTRPAGARLYTLDGSAPGLASTLYTGPFALSNSAILRAIAFNSNLTQSVEAGPVELLILPPCRLAVVTTGQGQVSLEPPAGPYPRGTIVTLTPRPAPGWMFTGWGGDLTGADSPAQLTMTADRTVTADFAPIPQYALHLTQTGEGRVQAAPPGGVHLSNTIVTLTATPDVGWVFGRWEGDLGGTTNPAQLTMNGAKSVRAIFQALFNLEATTAGGGGVQLTPPGGPYRDGTVVEVAAVPGPGWQFVQWLGDLAGGNPVASVVVTHDLAIEAVFGTGLGTGVVGSGAVAVRPDRALHPFGSLVELTAVPQAGNAFAFWSSPLSRTDNPVLFALTNPSPVVVAAFVPLPAGEHALTVLADGAGRVSVTPPGSRFAAGTVVELVAQPEPGQAFLGWTGAAAGSEPRLQVAMDRDRVIQAGFTRRPRLELRPGDIRPGSEGVRLTLTGEAGTVLEVQAAADPTRDWLARGTATNVTGTVQFLDATAPAAGPRFYRALGR